MTKLTAAFRNPANAPTNARFEVVTAVNLRAQVLWDFAPCSRVLLIATSGVPRGFNPRPPPKKKFGSFDKAEQKCS
jgi:hypothetical protein